MKLRSFTLFCFRQSLYNYSLKSLIPTSYFFSFVGAEFHQQKLLLNHSMSRMEKFNSTPESLHVTPQKYSTKVTEEKEKYLKMTIEEKRKIYKCGSKFNTLDDVLTWDKYFLKLKDPACVKGKKSSLIKDDVKECRPDLNKKVSLWRGDITTLEIDAIVNAANESLLGGGGVDGAIHRAAGRKLVEECALLKGCKTGNAKITGGYKLPAKHVIHTVGPIGEDKQQLKNAYSNCLKLVQENNLRSVAFPCISTGIYGYPNGKAAPIAIGTVRDWLEDKKISSNVDRVIFCLFLQKDVDIYEELMQVYFPVDSDNNDKSEEPAEEMEEKKTEDTNDESNQLVKSKKMKKDNVEKEMKEESKVDSVIHSKIQTETSNTEEDITMDTNSEKTNAEEMDISDVKKNEENKDIDMSEPEPYINKAVTKINTSEYKPDPNQSVTKGDVSESKADTNKPVTRSDILKATKL